MHIVILLDSKAVRRWQLDLADRLRALGLGVELQLSPGRMSPPAGLALLELFEETLYGRHRPLGQIVPEADLRSLIAAQTQAPADLILDLATGDRSPEPAAGRRLVLEIEGMAQEQGLAAALLDRRAPWIDIVLVEADHTSRVIVSGLPAVPAANCFIRGYEAVAMRLTGLIEQAVICLNAGMIPDQSPSPGVNARAPNAIAFGRFAIGTITEKIAHRLKRMSAERDQWVVGWRELNDDAVIDTLHWPAADYRWLPDDGLRYYADPFVFAYRGTRTLFVEEFVYATGRGHLSVATWTGDGWSTPRPCLERPYHLSWPRVFARDGEIWMLPETSEARTLELYRAVDFPYVWELARVLATDLSLADATVLERDDGWWMLAAIADRPGASSWDGLAVLRADDPLGTWRLTGPTGRPALALVDVRAARPAGDIIMRGGQFLRPVQDCSLSYGSALGIARIDALGEGTIRQTTIAHLSPKPQWNAIGVHTLNAAAGLEVIDINRGFDIARRPAHPR